MDSTDENYMQYHNTNPNVDINQFLNGVHDFANSLQDDTHGLDPALFDIGNGDTPGFHNQHTQLSQSNQQTSYNQSQRSAQSQSPALQSYKAGQNTFSAHPYNPTFYEQRPLTHPAFDSHLAARPSASPQSFEHYYPTNMNYNQQYGDPRFTQFTTQSQRQPTPTQPFRSQVPPHYMNMSNPSPQPQPHVSQIQNVPGMPYPYQQASQTHRFIDPASTMLNTGTQQYQNNPNEPQPAQTTPYFQPTANTLNPRELQAQYGFQVHRPSNTQTNTQQSNGILPQYAHQSILQFAPQNVAPAATKAAKEAKVKTKKDSKKGGSTSDSDDDLEIEEEAPEARPPIISVPKPADQAGKLLWEVVDAVWSPHNKPASADKMRTAVAFVGEAVRGLRDQWKSQNELLKKAELPSSATASQAVSLKAAVSAHRDTMERLVARLTQYGHPWILKRLGENHFTLAALYSFLVDRVNADDYDSSLVTGILQVGSKFENLDEEQLEKVKWTKVLNRFAKKSTNNSKTFAKQILDNAKTSTAKKSETALQGPSSPAGSANGKTVPSVAGVKRAREGSEPIQQAKKAAVKPSSKPLSLQIAEARKAKEKEKAAAAAAAAVKDVKGEKGNTNGTATTVPARPKVAVAATPKPSPFASLLSASKRPGTSNAERAAKDKPDVVKKPDTSTAAVKKETTVKTDSPPNRPASIVAPASSFLGFLVDMEKPKEVPTPKPEEIPNETPDARAKRLRKESRRRLRVSWKNDNELVETRIFEHDPDEDTGHEDSMMRDAGDTMKEGEMLKQKINIDDLDEDEDEVEYSPPSDVDFDALGTDICEQNFFKFGGSRKAESPSSEAQDKHEEGNLMTTYTSRDQPDSPKEPPEDGDDDDDFTPPLDFGEPSTDLIRQREKQILAQRQAYQSQQPTSSGFDLASVLANMQPQATPQTQQPQWQSSLFNTQPAAQPVPQQQQQPSLQGLDISKILAVAQQFQQQQQPTYQPPTVIPQQQTPGAAVVDPNIAALLASFNQQAAAQAEANSGHGPALPLGQGANPNPWPGSTATGEQSHRDQQSSKGKKKGQGKGKVPVDANGLPLNYKTQVCQFWLEGRCTKGDACTYKHSRD